MGQLLSPEGEEEDRVEELAPTAQRLGWIRGLRDLLGLDRIGTGEIGVPFQKLDLQLDGFGLADGIGEHVAHLHLLYEFLGAGLDVGHVDVLRKIAPVAVGGHNHDAGVVFAAVGRSAVFIHANAQGIIQVLIHLMLQTVHIFFRQCSFIGFLQRLITGVDGSWHTHSFLPAENRCNHFISLNVIL